MLIYFIIKFQLLLTMGIRCALMKKKYMLMREIYLNLIFRIQNLTMAE